MNGGRARPIGCRLGEVGSIPHDLATEPEGGQHYGESVLGFRDDEDDNIVKIGGVIYTRNP
jgi:hypothetical protein